MPAPTASTLASALHDRPRAPLWVGLSGGLDSTVLLHLLATTGDAASLRAIHVHHGLHADADRWTQHCERACAALGVALLFPVRSLGPRPGDGLKRTAYAGGGKRVVREDGSPVRPTDLARGGAITVWPDGHTDDADAPTLLIRIRSDQGFERRTREDWVVDDDIVAYSKLCTHVGCPVGLYQSGSALLLCPCHQSTFNVLNGARPVFGPAARSLPQLPLGLDDEGYIVATGDFSDPVGPGFWDRGR
jgi:ubiquinol-cytochrome c reductase iron-sulfur subunit